MKVKTKSIFTLNNGRIMVNRLFHVEDTLENCIAASLEARKSIKPKENNGAHLSGKQE